MTKPKGLMCENLIEVNITSDKVLYKFFKSNQRDGRIIEIIF